VRLVSITFQISTDLHSRLQTFVVVAIVVAAELESIPDPLLERIGNGFLGLRILNLIEGVIYWFCRGLSDRFCRVPGQLLCLRGKRHAEHGAKCCYYRFKGFLPLPQLVEPL